MAPVVFDSQGNFYGTTFLGGVYNFGTVFKLMTNGKGWTGSAIHNFTGNGDGAEPIYGLLIGADGNLYGTTPYGGAFQGTQGLGVVFEYKP